jgi:hypothetical protein
MRLEKRQRRAFSYLLTAALILGQVAAFIALPRPVAAELSADPNAEIVYIDENGVIRVLDTSGSPLVEWFSPDGGWDQIILLDINHDGDQEILALDNQGENLLRFSLFDPVLAQGSIDPNKQFNGIPWDTLFTGTIQGNGEYIVGGDFDTGIVGDEFIIGYRVGDVSVVRIYNAGPAGLDSNQRPTGRDYKVHFERAYPDIEYTFGIAGQLNGEGADEVILFDPESAITRMDIYRADQDMFLTDNETSSNDRFKFGATGQLTKDGPEELVAILTVSSPSRSSLRTYSLANDGELEEDFLAAFAPQPDWLFLADIRGNGDEEVFFLRNYPEGQTGPRLIMRDDWGDDQRQNTDLIEWALMDAGANNEFRAGVGADVDGDGRDEVILLRNDRIRVYHRPETGNEGSGNFNDYFVKTDNRRINLLAGDLDRGGFTTGPILLVSGNMIDAIVPAGTVSREFSVSVSNVGTAGGVGINAIVPPGNGWVQLNPTFATTPATFRVRFNATNLQPGSYNTTMTLVSSDPNAQNNNYVVYLNLLVVPPVLEPNPPILSVYRFPCATNPCSPAEVDQRNDPITRTIRLDGSAELAFRGALLGVPPVGGDVLTAGVDGLSGPIEGAEIDENGNIVIYDAAGNSRTLEGTEVSVSATHSTTFMIDPLLTWVTTATVDSNIVPANITLVMDPTVIGEEKQRVYAVLVLVADTRAGTPSGNVTLIPIEMANIGELNWAGFIIKE